MKLPAVETIFVKHIRVRADNEKSNEIYEPDEPGNDGVRRYRLPQNRYLLYLANLHPFFPLYFGGSLLGNVDIFSCLYFSPFFYSLSFG